MDTSKLPSLIGKQFGVLIIIAQAPSRNKRRVWVAKCVCGREFQIPGHCLKQGKYSYCRCKQMMRALNKDNVPEHSKQCGDCDKVLPKNEFSKSCRVCRACAKSKRKIEYEILDRAKHRAKEKGLDFNLTLDFIIKLNQKQNGVCPYTGMKLNWDKIETIDKKYFCPIDRVSLDRIDSTKGYTQDNVQLVTWVANNIKNSLSERDFLSMCEKIVDLAKKSGKI